MLAVETVAFVAAGIAGGMCLRFVVWGYAAVWALVTGFAAKLV